MQIHLFIMALVFIDFSTCFDFGGSGDESSFSLTAEELIPFVTQPPLKPIPHRKKSSKSKSKKKNKSKTSGKGSRFQHPRRVMDLCKTAFCDQLCLIKNNKTQCGCLKGFSLDDDLKTCVDIDECSLMKSQCEHMCINTPGSFHCKCSQGYKLQEGSNNTCEAICDPPCLNNGECVGPNKCQCPHGYSEPGCTALCDPPCANGGTCKRWNTCKCTPYFYGPTCLNAICMPQCLNGGRCIAPNVCHCLHGYHGRRCEKVRCHPPCQNRGRCVQGNVCLCQPEYSGARCQIAETKTSPKSSMQEICNPHCKTSKAPDYRFDDTQEGNDFLLDQSKCHDSSECSCRRTSKSHSCRKQCSLLSVPIKTTKLVRMHMPENYVSQCGTDKNRRCLRTRLVQKIVPRTVYQRTYRIQCV